MLSEYNAGRKARNLMVFVKEGFQLWFLKFHPEEKKGEQEDDQWWEGGGIANDLEVLPRNICTK